MAKTLDQRLAAAKLIKDETIPNANTAPRVGGAMEDINNAWNEELGEINVTTAFPPTSGYHTPETARAAVPDSYKRKGRTISYQTAAGTWVKEQYRGDSTAAWTTASNWFPILMAADQNVYNVTTQNPLAAGEYYNPTTARAAVPNQIRKLNLGLKYLSGYKEVDTLTITGPALTDGSISIFLNGVKNTASPVIYAGDTAIDIATKIRLMTWAGWTVGGTPGTAVVTFTRTTYDPVSAPTFSSTAGITANFVRTSTGQTPEWIHEEFIGPSTVSWTTDNNWRKLASATELAKIETNLNTKIEADTNLQLGILKTNTDNFTSPTIKRYFSNLNIPKGEKFKITVFSSIASWSRLAIFQGELWTSRTWAKDNIINGTTYEIRADIDIKDISVYLITPTTYGEVQVTIEYDGFINSVRDTLINTYYTIKGSVEATTTKIGLPFTIRTGTSMKNNGAIQIEFSDNPNFTGSLTLSPGERITASKDYKYARSKTIKGYYSIVTSIPIQPEMIPANSIGDNELKDLSINTGKIKDSAISTSKIQENAVDESKASFFYSKNLIDKNDADYTVGKYITNTGLLGYNPIYDTTGFIKVEALESYIFSYITGGATMRFILYYDANKNPISNTYVSYPTKLQVPASGSFFARITVENSMNSQFEKGTVATPYEAYKRLIPQKYIEQKTASLTVPFFFLPKDVYVAVGRTIEIYYEQVILNAFKWNIQAICTVGQPLKRKFRVIGDLAHVGTYTLTLRVFDDNGVKAGEKTCTIHIVNDSISSLKKLLPVGDSITNNKPWLTELTTLNANLTRVGTRGIGHEGRSGGTCTFYLNTDGTAKYTYEKNYIGVGSNAEVFNSTLGYSSGSFIKYKTESETSYSVFLFKTNHAENTAWNSSEVINISDTNPFWNFNNNTFSYNHYKTFQGITPDCIILWLGTNGINTTPETNINGALGIKQIIDNIRLEDTNIPIIVVNTIFRGNQNGIGVGQNVDGFSTPTSYKFDEDVKVLLLEQALENMIGDIDSYPNVYLCPVAATHDSEYNFMNLSTTKQGVNPRLTSTDTVYELFPVEATHPQTAGYLQAADEIYSTLCAVLQ